MGGGGCLPAILWTGSQTGEIGVEMCVTALSFVYMTGEFDICRSSLKDNEGMEASRGITFSVKATPRISFDMHSSVTFCIPPKGCILMYKDLMSEVKQCKLH